MQMNLLLTGILPELVPTLSLNCQIGSDHLQFQTGRSRLENEWENPLNE